jgi:hypothetical protein
MSLSFESRPFIGKAMRPTPEVHFDPDENLLIVATPWGPREAAKKAIDRMCEYLRMARDDRDVTSPFQRLSCLSDNANNLRVATLLANEILYRGENRNEYNAGAEIFAAYLDQDELVWVQAGQPQIFLNRVNRPTLMLGSQVDLAFDMSDDDLLPPLPSQLVGLDSTVNFTINSFRAREGDQLILLSHSAPPAALFRATANDLTIDSLVRELANDPHETPFWLGMLRVHQLALRAD